MRCRSSPPLLADAGSWQRVRLHGERKACRDGSVIGRLQPPGPTSGQSARADGSFWVVARVVETSWTGSATGDAVRRRDAGSSADAGLTGLDGRDERAWTGTVLLITQRSRVQIPPPLPRAEAISRTEKGPICTRIANGVVNAGPVHTVQAARWSPGAGRRLIARCSKRCYIVIMSSQPEITQRDLRMRSKEIMDAVERGQAFTVTRDGHRIGELIPLRQRRRFVSRAEFAAMSRTAPVIDADAFRADQDAAADQAGSAYDR